MARYASQSDFARILLLCTLAITAPSRGEITDPSYRSLDDACVPVSLDYHLRERSDKWFTKHSYELFDSSPRQYLIAVTVTPDHDVYAFGEFNRGFYRLSHQDQTYPPVASYHEMPISVLGDAEHRARQASKAIHAPFAYRGSRTTLSVLGEVITRDEHGRLWFTQGGEGLFSTSYSRLVAYDAAAPPGEQFCVYNIPDRGASVIGLAWDAANDRVWFSQGSLATGTGALVSFKPGEMQCANDFRWTMDGQGKAAVPFPYTYCTAGQDRACFKKYPIPDGVFTTTLIVNYGGSEQDMEDSQFTSGFPSHLVVPQPPHIDAGAVWFTLYFGDSIGRLDPTLAHAGQDPFHFFPLGWERYSPHQAPESIRAGFYVPNSAAPWDIDLNNTGDIVFTAYAARALVKFDMARYRSADYHGECERLISGPESNPCMQIMPVPRLGEHHRVHSLAVDPWGNTWFSVELPTCRNDNAAGTRYDEPASVGFVNAAWNDLVYFDHLNFDTPQDRAATARIDATGRTQCDNGQDIDWSHTGITTDLHGDTFSVWFTDAGGKIRQLKYLRPYSDGDIYCAITNCK